LGDAAVVGPKSIVSGTLTTCLLGAIVSLIVLGTLSYGLIRLAGIAGP